MRTYRIIILACLLVGFCAMVACAQAQSKQTGKAAATKPKMPEWAQQDSASAATLGSTLSDILLNANRVRVYSLMPKQTVTADDIEIDEHYVRGALLTTLTREQMAVFKYMLIADGRNYSRSSTLPMIPHHPVLEFEFARKKEVAHVFVSLDNFTWGVRFRDKVQFLYNYADDEFINRFCAPLLELRRVKSTPKQ